MRPICIDLFCGLGGWSEAFLAEGWECIGFDIERHDYGTGGYPGQLVLQDVTTLHGSQFRNADCIVASPPCQEFSYMAMPWSRARQIAAALREEVDFPVNYTGSRTVRELRALFDACFRIQREACEAAGRYIPMVVENVKGAQPWVGRAKANFGSFYFWGDINSVGGAVIAGRPQFGAAVRPARRGRKNDGGSWFDIAHNTESGTGRNPVTGEKCVEVSNIRDGHSHTRHLTNQREHDGAKTLNEYAGHGSLKTRDGDDWRHPDNAGVKAGGLGWDGPGSKGKGFNVENARRYREGLKGPGGDWFADGRQGQDACADGIKHGGDCFNDPSWAGRQGGVKQHGSGPEWFDQGIARHSSRSDSRKAASAAIAKIPFPLAQHVAKMFRPVSIARDHSKGVLEPL